ncbi:MAG: DUF4857 domain-containing protein [Pseudomonadota bacterium]
MMPRIAKLTLILVLTAVLAAFLPDLYWNVFNKKAPGGQLYYSAVSNDFLFRGIDENDQTVYETRDGRKLTREEFETNLPFLHIHDMEKWGKTPVEIDGLVFDSRQVHAERQFFRITPYHITEPNIELYPLFESQSKYADLENPREMFRIRDRIEFIRAEDNSIDEEMSTMFTDKLKEAGFTFPAKYLAGNPTTMKPFDEGYFIVDDNNKIFHLKKIKDKPWCKDTGLAPPSGVKYMSISEDQRKEFYGCLITGDDRVFLISYFDYRLIELPIREYYQPDRHGMFFIADPLNRTIMFNSYTNTRDITGSEKITAAALDRNYKKVMSYSVDRDRSSTEMARRIERIIFPFYLERNVAGSEYMGLNLEFNGASALIGVAASLILLVLLTKIRSESITRAWPEFLFTAFTGIYGLIALLIAGSTKKRVFTEK